LLGADEETFRAHIEILKKDYYTVSPDDILSFSYGGEIESKELHGVLFSFDDGLSDHFKAAEILKEYNIKGLFFLPSCVFEEKQPINPVIIHYAFSILTITEFLEALYELPDAGVLPEPRITYTKGVDDPWDIIKKVKHLFKYRLKSSDARMLLLSLYNNVLLSRYPDLFEHMHLSKEQVRKMLSMGHSIGSHTKTHVSIAHEKGRESDDILRDELIGSKHVLEKIFKTKIVSMSYPFGEPQDCLAAKELLEATNEYKIAFTIEQKVNTKETSPFELGRYCPLSTDTASILKEKIDSIMEGKMTGYHSHISTGPPL